MEETFQSPDTRDGRIDCNEESKSQLVGDTKDGKKKGVSFRERLKNPGYKDKFTYSMFMAVSFVALGMYTGQHGPTFIDIQIITNTDLKTASTLFTGANAGYLAGSVLIGLIYNKLKMSVLAFVLTLCLGIVNIFLPYCTQFEVMVCTRFSTAMFVGGLTTGLSSEHMAMWGSDANGILQFIHFGFSFGGVISPLFAEPFLAEKIVIGTEATYESANETAFHNATTTTVPQQVSPESNVKYVYLITGIFTIVTSLPFLLVCLKRADKSKQTVKKRKFSQRNAPFSVQILMLSGMCLFHFFYGCIEVTFFSFLMTFLVEEYDSVSKSKGAFVTAIAWAAFAVARFLMIFMTKMFTTVQILIILTTASILSFSAFTGFAYLGMVNALIVLSAIAPLTFSGILAASISWTEKEMFPVTGMVTSCVFVSESLGYMANPSILGYLMEEHTNMWFCYLQFIETIVMSFIFIFLLIFCRYFVDRKYGSLSSHYYCKEEHGREMEITNGHQSQINQKDKDILVDKPDASDHKDC